MAQQNREGQSGIAENLKKGITEMLILAFLEKQDMHIYAILTHLDKCSGGVCKIAYPYAAIYRLLNQNYIVESGKRNDENRLRQYYHITEAGKHYLAAMKADYDSFIGGVSAIFQSLNAEEQAHDQ